MRRWYVDQDADHIVDVAERCHVPLFRTPAVNCQETRDVFRQCDLDLGLSLGNGYIGEAVFSIPPSGMLNVHTEVLPDFRGASSVIWAIYEGRTESGFSIHQVDKSIDTGPILYQQRYPIQFDATLYQTVRNTLAVAYGEVPKAVRHVCENYEQLRVGLFSQGAGKSYTTPTFWQFVRMVRNHRRMRYQRRGPTDS